MLNRISSRKILAATCSVLLLTASSSLAQDTVTLRAVAPYPETNYLSEPLRLFADILSEKSDGKMQVQYLGAEEVVAPQEQFDAVRNGVVDLALGVASYYTGSVPEAISIQYNRDKSAADLRQNGYIDLMKQLHRAAGVEYVANASGTPGRAFRLYTSKEVATLDDFVGMRFRVSPVYTPIVEGIGATPIALPPADTYAALERGIVDGLGWTYAGTIDYGFPEVAKYVIDYPFYSIVSNIIMNADVYDGLSDDMKADLNEAAIEFEEKVADVYQKVVDVEDEKLKAAGMTFITLSEADAQKYLAAAYEGGWADFLAKNAAHGAEIQKMLE